MNAKRSGAAKAENLGSRVAAQQAHLAERERFVLTLIDGIAEAREAVADLEKEMATKDAEIDGHVADLGLKQRRLDELSAEVLEQERRWLEGEEGRTAIEALLEVAGRERDTAGVELDAAYHDLEAVRERAGQAESHVEVLIAGQAELRRAAEALQSELNVLRRIPGVGLVWRLHRRWKQRRRE